jgi:hypothetical protein
VLAPGHLLGLDGGMGDAAAVRFKELCMDTTGGEGLARFWSAVSGLAFIPDGAAGDLSGPTEGHRISMCTVPEPKSVKNRVHLDVYTTDVADLERLGATVVLPSEKSGFHWTVMTDPEGGEFCAFVRRTDEIPAYRVHGLVVDSHDPLAIATWWGERLGVEPETEERRRWWWLEDVPGLPIRTWDFVPVPEPKTVKNRIHWDVYGDPDALVAAGATLLRAKDDEIDWHVLADPEGNEFCAFDDR